MILDVDYNVVLAYAFGLLLLYFLGRLLFIPLRFLVRLVYSGLLGGILLWLINLIGGLWGVQIPINPATALVVGFLGIPGLILIFLLQYLLLG
ncbi:MAG: pro-sigmaK processing inhibitor BofA family protein [Firmicutes bacterium]|nr:pro-sigmaK processing inhibitor BofA family protein [Bacillota bacterium]